MQPSSKAICSILPPHILRKLADKPELRDRVLRNLAITEGFRGVRQAFVAMPLLPQQRDQAPHDLRRAQYNQSPRNAGSR